VFFFIALFAILVVAILQKHSHGGCVPVAGMEIDMLELKQNPIRRQKLMHRRRKK
jgi:hypothetical protein